MYKFGTYMVYTFGTGILMLLHEQFGSKLTRKGTWRTDLKASDLLKQLASVIQKGVTHLQPNDVVRALVAFAEFAENPSDLISRLALRVRQFFFVCNPSVHLLQQLVLSHDPYLLKRGCRSGAACFGHLTE